MRRIIFDMECDGFLWTVKKIHCIAYCDADDPDAPVMLATTSDQKRTAIDRMLKADVLIGHNIAGYDIPVIEKLHGRGVGRRLINKNIFDTYIASCMCFPDNTWGHSLEAWSKELKMPYEKIEVTDWSTYDDTMGQRCLHDVEINRRLFKHLHTRDGLSADGPPMRLETQVARIQAWQEYHGVYFDIDTGHRLLATIDDEMRVLRDMITRDIPAKTIHGPTLDAPFKKDGDLSVRAIKYLGGHVIDPADGAHVAPSAVSRFSVVSFEEFNLDSPKQVTEYLLSIGWEPTEWNYVKRPGGKMERTSPKLTENSWDSLPGELGKRIGRYKMLAHRRRWLQNEKNPDKGALPSVRSDWRVPAEAMPCATPTARYRHTGTVCNIPRPSTPLGPEIRGLFIAPPGDDRWLVGCDLKGIEARMLVHYCKWYKGGDALEAKVLKGDFHSINAETWGCTRDQAKNGLYALMYGCAGPKLASQLGKPTSEGDFWLGRFWEDNPAIKTLVDSLEAALKDPTGAVYGLDGRKWHIRETRTALNTLLQGGAAIVFKKWMVATEKYCTAINSNTPYRINQVIAYHDELQFEVHAPRDIAEQFAKDICAIATKVGKDMKLKVPIEADPKVGKTWAETH